MIAQPQLPMKPCTHLSAPSSGTASHAKMPKLMTRDQLGIDRAQLVERLRAEEEPLALAAGGERARANAT